MLRAAIRRGTRDLAFGLRGATSRVHEPRFWRALYALLELRAVIRVSARCLALVARSQAARPAEVLDRAVPPFETGWPHHEPPWVNLDVQRFHRRVLGQLDGNAAPAPQRRPRTDARRLRLGVLGLLDDAFFFTRSFFEAQPDRVEIVAFDLGSKTRTAEAYIAPLAEAYHSFSLAEIDELAQAIEDADLDLLLADVRKPHIYPLLDRITTPCVALLCAEVYLRHHPSVNFHLYPFQQADYFVRGDRLYCGTSDAFFGDQVVYPSFFPYDLHGVDPASRRPWAEREPLIVFHGRLFKASQPYVEVILGLLREDPELRFVLMGKDTLGALDRIRASARRHGLEDRVTWEGPFNTAHDEAGGLVDPSWGRLLDLLSRARLAPDPWPLAGGASRVEAYAAGAPTAHMGIRIDSASWGRPQHMLTADHTALLVPSATAYSLDGYREISWRALHDERYAEDVAAEQAAIAQRVGDPHAFWRQLLHRYEQWLAR